MKRVGISSIQVNYALSQSCFLDHRLEVLWLISNCGITMIATNNIPGAGSKKHLRICVKYVNRLDNRYLILPTIVIVVDWNSHVWVYQMEEL